MEESGATTLFLVRHGETVDNARQIMQGQTQGCLNEKGREQAQQVAQRLNPLMPLLPATYIVLSRQPKSSPRLMVYL